MQIIEVLAISRRGTKAKVKVFGRELEFRLNKDQSLCITNENDDESLTDDEFYFFTTVSDRFGVEFCKLIIKEINSLVVDYDNY